MAAKIVAPKKVRGIRKEMECNAYRNYPGRKGCGAAFSFVPSDCRDWDLGVGGYNYEGPHYKVNPIHRMVRCPKCKGYCLVDVVRPGVEYNRQELARMEDAADLYGRGQGGH